MNNSNDSEYVFWLNHWREGSASWPKLGRFKCIITKTSIKIIPIQFDPDKELYIDITSVRRCKLGYDHRNRRVELLVNDTWFYLDPVNPIDPVGIQNNNHSETLALIKVVEAFQSNLSTEIEPNAYFRQLATKSNLNGFTVPQIQWDRYTSPWEYYDRYQGKYFELKIFARKLVIGVVSAMIAAIAIVAVFYMLLLMDIF